MILEIARLIQGLVPEEPSSIVCIWQTKPTYLVFGTDPDRPICAIQFGPGEELARMFDVLKNLHGQIPGRVASPLGLVRLRNGQCALIQDGLAGFSVRRLPGDVGDYPSFRAQALKAVDALHEAIGRVDAWRVEVRPGDDLRRAAAACRSRPDPIPSSAYGRAMEWARDLDDIGTISSVLQHGDFGLMNLLMGESGLVIIDFDEFGTTAMPLYDHIALAFSIHHHESSSRQGGTIDQILAECCRPGLDRLGVTDRQFCGMIMHFLLWQIAQSNDRRRSMVQRLLGYVQRLSDRPTSFLTVVDVNRCA